MRFRSWEERNTKQQNFNLKIHTQMPLPPQLGWNPLCWPLAVSILPILPCLFIYRLLVFGRSQIFTSAFAPPSISLTSHSPIWSYYLHPTTKHRKKNPPIICRPNRLQCFFLLCFAFDSVHKPGCVSWERRVRRGRCLWSLPNRVI